MNLRSTIRPGANPGLLTITGKWWIRASTPYEDGSYATKMKLVVFREDLPYPATNGEPRFVQNVKYINNMENGIGASRGTEKWTMDFDNLPPESYLVDSSQANTVPYYLALPEVHYNFFFSTIFDYDTPAVPLYDVDEHEMMPTTVENPTNIDFTFHFDVWAAWEFESQNGGSAIYFFGSIDSWESHLDGEISLEGTNYIWTPGENNANTGSNTFIRINDMPDAYKPPAAEDVDATWGP